jgi:uncharacterized protein YbbC (DUF1343 family)
MVMMRGQVGTARFVVGTSKIISVFLFAFFVPKFFVHYFFNNSNQSPRKISFKLGLENLTAAFLKTLTSRGDLSYNVGLITNQTGKDQQGCSNVVYLRNLGVKIAAIFCPEESETPEIQHGMPIPVVSLYDKQGHRTLTADVLTSVDVLIFDIQDAGMRHYRYVTTLLNALQAAATYNKLLVVLDRPNLLGASMEGLVEGFVSSHDAAIPIPIRYGMTVGELATYLNNNVLKQKASLHIVPMTNYDRTIQPNGQLVTHLSKNITSLASCHNYSFLGLIGEVSPFDIGIGTEHAFQCILLPDSLTFSKKKWYELQVMLKEMSVDSSLYRYFSERKKEYCSGLRLSIADIDQFSSFTTLLKLLLFFKDAGVKLSFSKNFDCVFGTTQVRELVEGKANWCEFESTVNKQLNLFFAKARSSFLYKPLPKLMMV